MPGASLCALTPCASHMATQAEQLLTRNHANALSSLEAVKAEVLSVRDSITTTEARNALRYSCGAQQQLRRGAARRCASRGFTTGTCRGGGRLAHKWLIRVTRRRV